MNDIYININKVAEIKGLKSTRSIRMAINNGKYKARTIPVNGGYSYEILYSSLEPEVQEKLEDEEMRSTALVPIKDSKPTFISESARMTSLARADIVAALKNIKSKYKTKKEAEFVFLDLYNSGMLLPQVYKFIGKISIGTLRRWVNSKTCPNDKNRTIKECLNAVQKQDIDKNKLNYLMMSTKTRVINKHGITFLGFHYRNELLLDVREEVFIRYSLFDLSKIDVYSLKGEFLCIARQVEKVHPMANVLGTVKDMQDLKQKIQRQGKQLNKAKKEFIKCFPQSEVQVLEIESEPIIEIEQFEPEKTVREHKLTPREKQMNKPMFESDYEKFEWLMNNGCTNPEDRKWLADYIRSDEYYNLYGD